MRYLMLVLAIAGALATEIPVAKAQMHCIVLPDGRMMCCTTTGTMTYCF